MGRCKDCEDNIRDNSFEWVAAKSVDYEGCFSEHSKLDESKCYNVEEVLCESNNLIDELFDSLDVSGLGESCLDYTVEDEELGLRVTDVLIGIEGAICDHEERIAVLEEGVSSGCCNKQDECGNVLSKCVTYEGAFFGTGNEVIDGSYSDYKSIEGVGFSDLIYKATRKGVVKLTVEVFMSGVGVLEVGLSKNDFTPENSPLSKTLINAPSISTFFVEEVNKNDTVKIKFKNISGSPEINTVKILVEMI